MANLLDLPNELITEIVSHLQKPAHILQFVLVNRRIRATIIHLLYRNIALDHCTAYRSSSQALLGNYHFRSAGRAYPYTAISSLTSRLSCQNLHLGPIVRTMDLVLDSSAKTEDFGLGNLLPHLIALEDLRLSIEEVEAGTVSRTLSPSMLGKTLSAVSKTLRTLYLHADQGMEESDGTSIGPLRHFSILESLSIQGHVLLGYYADDYVRSKWRDLRLPSGLEILHLDCCGVDVVVDKDEKVVSAALRSCKIWLFLTDLFEGNFKALPELRKINVLLEKDIRHPKIGYRVWTIDEVSAKASQRGMDIWVQPFGSLYHVMWDIQPRFCEEKEEIRFEYGIMLKDVLIS